MSNDPPQTTAYHGEVLRMGDDFITIDRLDFGLRLKIDTGDVSITLVLASNEAGELGRHLRNAMS
jgi:hypothetical protein